MTTEADADTARAPRAPHVPPEVAAHTPRVPTGAPEPENDQPGSVFV